jgi:hypothetical protein
LYFKGVLKVKVFAGFKKFLLKYSIHSTCEKFQDRPFLIFFKKLFKRNFSSQHLFKNIYQKILNFLHHERIKSNSFLPFQTIQNLDLNSVRRIKFKILEINLPGLEIQNPCLNSNTLLFKFESLNPKPTFYF